jgi:hypothetical protein
MNLWKQAAKDSCRAVALAKAGGMLFAIVEAR